MSMRASQKGIKLHTEVAPNVPDCLRGDPDRLHQILFKIIENAVEVSPSGRIVIDVRRSSAVGTGDSLCLLFSVQDSGIVVPEEEHEALFDPFRKANATVARKYGGAGLGLALCGRLVRLMEGRIWLDSNGRGNRFHFTAHFGIVAQGVPTLASASLPVSRRASAHGARIVLVAEDNRVNQIVAVRILEKRGFRVVVADTGREAVHKFAETQPDLILMDVQMPDMDGYEATRRIRERESQKGGHVPIIALTATSMKDDRERCLASGMDGFLFKPIQGDVLIESIEEMLTRRSFR
jgi:CheY-like chemotaxis protein